MQFLAAIICTTITQLLKQPQELKIKAKHPQDLKVKA